MMHPFADRKGRVMKDARLHWRIEHWLGKTWIVRAVMQAGIDNKLYWVPPMPKPVLKRFGTEPVIGPKSLEYPSVPPDLRRVPGIRRDPELEQAAFDRGPVPDMDSWFPRVRDLTRTYMWVPRVMSRPRMNRALRSFHPRGLRTLPGPNAEALALTPEELSARIKAKGAELGLSAVGIAPYDEKYVWDINMGQSVGDRVIVCLLEQDYEATQTAPSNRSERAALATYAALLQRDIALAEYIRDLGYTARESTAASFGVGIHYGVQAGLGQLGMNGQLLTPFAGSRCRIAMISTDAPLAIDHPVDYGVIGLCDVCQVCVRRCPSGAIPSVRKFHRGVEKAKIKPERCAPMVSQIHGCAICMKTCPVQKYGLPAVLSHYDRTGKVLGKGTDELEGYYWPDGRRYGPGEKPRSAVSKEMLEPDGRPVLPLVPWPN
jgi:epoxyqueuosine reductase